MSTDYLKTNEDIEPAAETDPQKSFTFKGVALDPFSRYHRLASWRLGFAGPVSSEEDAVTFIYMLTTGHRNSGNLTKVKHALDAIRGDAIPAFRIAATDWADALNLKPDDITEAIRIVDAIREDWLRADSVEVEPGKAAPGNA